MGGKKTPDEVVVEGYTITTPEDADAAMVAAASESTDVRRAVRDAVVVLHPDLGYGAS